ncbi:MAG: VWA domain-containing protein, partial [Pirellulales bacterium]
AKIPIFTVGVGSDRRPANVRIGDLVAPARAFPGDSFKITGYLQCEGLADRTVDVELLSRSGGAGATEEGSLESVQRVTLGGRGEIVPVKFDITPAETGRRVYRLRVKAPPEDSNAADDHQEVDVEIVDRKTKVLLVASGPTREYTFLRNQLKRDKGVEVDVWLQSAPEGVSQDANRVLTQFPTTPQELFEYDCIVAFDSDWRALDENQVELLERWVAEKAGGLIVLAGPVEMDRWVQDAKLAKIRGLYPVEFNRHMTLLEEGRFGSTTAWPIDFTREGLEAEFMWLADSAVANEQTWSDFPGVFGYYGVRGAKPGATVYGRYSDPEAKSGAEQPVYLAGQFYGSGRVFYLGSGEMWRLRALDDRHFEQLYLKLIRHVSQGRLLLGSSRGMLLVDRDRYLLGNTVV